MQPFLFKLKEENDVVEEQSLSPQRWLKDEFIRRKLESPFGYLLFSVLVLGFSWLIAHEGREAGMVLLAVLQVLPLLLASMFNLRFGLFLTVFAAFTLMGIKKATGGLPVGILLDATILVMVAGIYLKQIRRRDWRGVFHIFTITIVAWLGYNFIELFNPASPNRIAWLYAVRDTGLRMVLFFVPLFALTRLRHLENLARFWILLTTLGAIYAILQEFFGLRAFEELWITQEVEQFEKLFLDGRVRKFSFFSTPGVMGMLMAATSVFSLPLFFHPNLKQYEKVLLGFCVALMWVAMLLSGTRTAFIVVPVSFLFLLVLSFNRRMIPIGIAIFGLWLLLFFVPSDHPVLQRYRSTFRPTAAISLQERLQNQEYIKPYIRSHPIGGGLGMTGKRGQQFSPFQLFSQFRPEGGFVLVAIEMGWVGLLLYLGLIFMVLYIGIRYYFKIRRPEIRLWLLAFLGGIFALVIGNYSQNTLMTLPSSIFFYIAMAAIVLLRRFDNEEMAFDPFDW